MGLLDKIIPEYWISKSLAYLHDPFDKPFRIKGHQERARELMEIFGHQVPNEESWKIADAIAAGFERGIVPDFKAGSEESGAIPFKDDNGQAVITHPISNTDPLKIDLSQINPDTLWLELKQFLNDEIQQLEQISNDYQLNSKLKFFYLHLALRFKLSKYNIGGLGALWHRLPADTRFPDHSIWHHNALTSAIYSSLELGGGYQNLGLMVLSITPVQPFIAKARKVRDFWTGSVLLSWLAFEGIAWIMENLGPDHILYPSLIDQPLVNQFMKLKYGLEIPTLAKQKDIASFPNKFVCLIPLNYAEEIGDALKKHIQQKWIEMVSLTGDEFIRLIDSADKEFLKKQLHDQASYYWDIQWAATRLLSVDDKNKYHTLMPESTYKVNEEIYQIFNNLMNQSIKSFDKGIGILYSASHSMVQMVLAAAKAKRESNRPPQMGTKCSMCHEFEVLHGIPESHKLKAGDYEQRVRKLWQKFTTEWAEKNSKYDFDIPDEDSGSGSPEKLCAICLTKRIGYKAIRKSKNHVLYETFKEIEKIPSTTELALYNYFKRNNISKDEQPKLAQLMHNNQEVSLKDLNIRDRYYAILMMDGDWMGKLVNGETIEATWKSIMHPETVQKITSGKFPADFVSSWRKIFDNPDLNKRLLTPSIHASISEALGDFSIYHVSRIVRENHGRLIYAGGDDVCALLPVDSALKAAREIREFYHKTFILISENGAFDAENNVFSENTKLSISTGGKDKISISAGLLICHHKEDLKSMIQEAHHLLDSYAKKKAGRNALAIELRKRGGGPRYFYRKWDDNGWKSFEKLGKLINADEFQEVSMSLAYRLQLYKDGILNILESNDVSRKSLLHNFIKSLLEKSITTPDKTDDVAESIIQLIFDESLNKNSLNTDSLIIASFLIGQEDIS